MSFLHAFLLVLVVQFVYGDDYYGNNCPSLSKNLDEGCSVNSDCTKITCSISDKGKSFTWTIKINKCEDPVTVDISVDAGDIHWSKTFNTDERVGVPGLSVNIAGLPVGVFVKVSLPDSGSNLRLKVSISFGIGSLSTSTSLVDSDLPISTYECGFVRWWKNLDTVFQVLFGLGILVVLIGPCICCCYCCCCRRNTPGTIVTQGPPAATVISTNNTTVPMQPFVNEI